MRQELLDGLRRGDAAAFEELVELAVQRALQALPGVVRRLSDEAFVAQTKARKFYAEHPELSEHRPLVQKLIEQEEASAPGAQLDDLLARVLPKARLQISRKQSVGSPIKVPATELDKLL